MASSGRGYSRRRGGGRRQGSSPQGVGGILRKVLRVYNLGPRLPELDLRRRWEQIIGPELAPHTHPESLKQGELTLRVPSGVWAQEILGMSEDILGRIGEQMKTLAPQRLQVRIGRLPPRPVAAKPKGPLPPVESLSEETRRRLAEIADPEVREALTRFARWHKRKGG